MVVWYGVLLAYGITSAIWLYKTWSWIPPEQRHTGMWKKYISPGQAVGFMFIPYFNMYWMFVMYLGIADVFERMRVAYPTQTKSVKDLALWMLIGSMLFFPAGPFLHFMFLKRVDLLAAEMDARMRAAAPPATA
jgi:hypothetical protein